MVKVDGVELTEENSIPQVMADKKVGDQLSLEIYRDELTITLQVTLLQASE